MQFARGKRPGARIKVLLYEGYDKEKKRSKIVQLGSLDPITFEENKPINGQTRKTLSLRDAIRQRPNADQLLEELDAYIAGEIAKQAAERDKYLVLKADQAMSDVIAAIERGVRLENVDWIWMKMDQLRSTLRKHKYPKPPKVNTDEVVVPKSKRTRKKKVKTDDEQKGE